MHSIRKNVLCAVSEAVGGFPGDDAHLQKIGEVAIKGDLAKAYDHPNARQGLNLIGKMGRAVANLLRQRLISRRRTADDGGYPGVPELEAIIAGDAGWLAGKPQLVENRIHKGSGAVSGERASRPIGAVSAGGKPQNKNAGARVSEAGNGAGPVGLVLIGTASGFSDSAAIIAKARATVALDDRLADLLQNRREGLNFRTGHCIP
jgi:hypothetical protein